MLGNLDQIDWNKAGFPQIPDLLRDLFSNEMPRRDAAYDVLIEMLVPWSPDPGQYGGNVDLMEPVQREVIPLVVPFLIELLAEPTLQHKIPILILLREIASYAEFGDIVERTEENKDIYMNHAVKLLKAVDAGNQIYTELVRKTIDQGIQEYAKHLLELLDYLKKDEDIRPYV